jgi:hypothetical protein
MAYQVTTGQFIGRTQELARLRQLLARAADGQPLLVVLGGEAGSARPAWPNSSPRQRRSRAPACCAAAACRWGRRAFRSRR